MIPMHSHHDWPSANPARVRIDQNGNIEIRGEALPVESAPAVSIGESSWEVTEKDSPNIRKQANESIRNQYRQFQEALRGVRGSLFRTTNALIEEGSSQYRTSFRDGVAGTRRIDQIFRSGASTTWTFLTQPVWVLRKDREPREYSRATLFLLDVVRFGGTFAAIFVVLFVSLNYQSFWDIVRPHLDPLERSQSIASSLSEVDHALKEKLLRSPNLAVAGREDGDLLSYLPEVGPPENRLIIPKLELNIPLVTPSFESLLEENWEGVEKDIQDALQYGVVHYPGTARPGQAGNFFVTGHSSYYPWAQGDYKNVFARLHELEVGDEYWVYYGGDKHRFVIQGKKEVKPSDVTVLDQPINKRTGTLMTCTPVGTTLRRLILTAQEIDPHTGIALKVGEVIAHPLPEMKLQNLPI